MSPVLVGLDVGTTSVKGVAIDDDGGVLAGASSDYALSTPRPGWAEQDPEDWWRATELVLRTLRAETGAPHAIGLSGQMHGLVALDGRGRPLRPAILWNDQRTAARVRRDRESGSGSNRLIALTGNRALPGFTAPKLLWLRRHEPELWSQVRSVMLPKDYVRLRLTGRAATELSDASGHAAARRRRPPVERGGAQRPRARRRAAPRSAGGRRARPGSTTGSRSPPARETRRPGRSESG